MAKQNTQLDSDSELSDFSDVESETDSADKLFEEEEDEIYPGFPSDYYESKDYEAEELECLKSIKMVIKRIKSLVTAFNHSTFLGNQLIEAQKAASNVFLLYEKFFKILIQDVKTRWNSTHALIDRYLLLFKYLESTINNLAIRKKKTLHQLSRLIINRPRIEIGQNS